MTFTKSLLLGSAAALTAAVGAQAADLPSRKAAPVEYVKVCDAYGAGFFFIPGTSTCLKVGGYVRVDYDYRPARERTGYTAAVAGPPAVAAFFSRRNPTDFDTTGFYNRGVVSMDARTQTSWGTVQTVFALRMETGGGLQEKLATGSSLEAAYVRFAGFTFGQASQPFAFASGWAWNTPYSQGWPNGVRQLAYTYVFGGGFSATVAATDAKAYNAVAQAVNVVSSTNAFTAAYPSTFERGGIVWVGNLRYDQAWGSVQLMGAYQKGGTLAGGTNATIGTAPNALAGTNESGWAIGGGLAVKLPMLAAGDELQLQAVYADRLANLLGDGGINTPSAAAYGYSPLGGPAVNFANGKGYSLLAQMRHYWLPTLRSQLYVSYTSRELHRTTDGFASTNAFLTSGTTIASNSPAAGAKGSALGIGHALVWSPVRDFDLGVEVTYLRATWNQAAVRFAGTTAPNGGNKFGTFVGSIKEDAFIGKVRVQRNF